jgi:hypothetical protein
VLLLLLLLLVGCFTLPRINYIDDIVNKLAKLMANCPIELLDVYALLVLIKGTDTTSKNVHDAWSVWQNNINPKHKSLMPFEALPPEIQELDDKYRDAIHAVSREIEEV